MSTVNEPEPLVEDLVQDLVEDATPAVDNATTITVGRRGFLQMSSAIAAAVTAGIVGIPVVRAVASPALAKPIADNWVKVADDIAVLDIGVPIRVDFVQTQDDAWITNRALNGVWLYTEDGEKFKAYNGHCTHLGCGYMLAKDGKSFVCPCHRGQFDIKTGAVLGGPPPRPLDELETEVRDGSVFVKYRDFRLGVAERVPV
ncbi:MAG TPA: Rieske 2Fe-2S domain-containing protein [Gemmatimonadaceae bacterium]|nr:Rieske 2Fe-2S domain-containing protein [Gemmatimonadaceae bacterium]